MKETLPARIGTGPLPTIIQTPRGPVECVVSGEGPVILALHGAMGGYDQGLLLVRTTIASSQHRCVSISRPGYLGTPLTSGRTPEDQADLCAAVLGSLRIRHAAVIAVSGGGPCAIQFALRHRDCCWGLVLCSTCTGRLQTPLPLSFHVMNVLARWPVFVDWMRRRSAEDPEPAARCSIRDPVVRSRTMNDPDVRMLYDALSASTFDRMALRLPGTRNDIFVTRTATTYPLARIAVPVLAVHGTADRIVRFSHANAIEAQVPGAELLAIEGGEHVCIFTHRHEVMTRVNRFLAAHLPVPMSHTPAP